ncbi:hypothetical protein BCR42DRAFT_442852 [Absidia repens]|uniref:Uncharacterized protein n=1 Tax=Absidia repens TaxID=90262 RepID=A0A1X2I141_9FUNG|nr:hypothetical protein BCR42DRAFT_442852 [Absidia repens]
MKMLQKLGSATKAGRAYNVDERTVPAIDQARQEGQRRRVLQKATQKHILTISERMALNFIFIIDNDKPTPTFLTKNEWKHIIRTMNDMYPPTEISAPTRDMLYRFSKAAKKDMGLVLEVVQQLSIDNLATVRTMITKLLNNIAQKYDGLNVECMKDDSFINARVDPIVSAFFSKTKGISPSTVVQRLWLALQDQEKKFDPTLRGKIPDLSIPIKGEATINNIIIMEVKAPNASTEDADLLKLANMLKDSIDSMHKNCLTFVGLRVFGVLMEGHQCDLYSIGLDYTYIKQLLLPFPDLQ